LRFHSPKAQGEEHPKNADETKVVGSQEEAKAETFDTSKISQGEGRRSPGLRESTTAIGLSRGKDLDH